MNRQAPWYQHKRLGSLAVVWTLLAQASVPAHAVSTATPGYAGFVSQLPGVYTKPPDPNVMFTLDDSGSMRDETIPDSSAADNVHQNMWNGTSAAQLTKYLSSNVKWRYYRSSTGNPLYYDPKVRYQPWPYAGDDTKLYSAAVSTAACYYADTLPVATTGPWPATPPALNCTGANAVDLAARVTVIAGAADDETKNYWPATYFRYIGPAGLQADGTSVQGNNTTTNWQKVEIKSSVAVYPPKHPTADATQPPKGAARTDCAGTTCTYTEEIQNFANWFQYYRARLLMAKGGVAAAFAKQGTNIRVGFSTINSPVLPIRGVQTFSSASRIAFYAALYPRAAGNSTPLRLAMDNVGKYFQRSDIGNPWAEDPTSTTTVGTEYACRRSFHILSTDGFWNGAGATAPANADNDSFSGFTPSKPDGTKYTYSDTLSPTITDPLIGRFTVNPFKSTTADTLADVAAYYWKTDLRPGPAASGGLDNVVVPSPGDPAFWQHLSTFTIGFGITGTGLVTKVAGGAADLSTQTARDQLISDKTALNWTIPIANDPRTGDDLVHASMNGRGQYFSATNPRDLANGLAAALSAVADQPFDFASVAADAPQVRSGGRVYQATFSPNKWYGRLYAFLQGANGVVNNIPIDANNPINASQVWEASNKMPAPSARNIFTSTGLAGSGANFKWAELTSAQKGYLNNDSTVLDYLRGDDSNEASKGGTFRDRSRYKVGAVTGGVLGDVVGGSPVKGPDAGGGYDRLPKTATSGQSTYATFRSSTGTGLDNMRTTMFLGANDGMLHALNLNDGVERFAYVPSTVYNVPRATTSGLIAEQKLLALSDVAYSHRFTVDGPPNVGDAYLGGAWKTILVGSTGAGARGIFAMDVTNPEVGGSGFGKGNLMWEFSEANSDDMGFVPSYPHIARLRNDKWGVIFGNGYDSKNGKAKLFILDAENGSVIRQFEVDAGPNNGMSQPNFIYNDTREVIAVYAGDLKGNLWKFDVSDTTASNWAPAFGVQPFFTAVNDLGQAQPITVMPEITQHPNGGALLSFGTGKLFESSDTAVGASNVNLQTQSLYGIWDKPSETAPLLVTAPQRSVKLLKHTVSAIPASANYGQTVTTTDPDWSSQRGWYFDLGSGGERSNLAPLQIGSKTGQQVLFMVANTPVPSDPCANGGSSKIFALNPVTGNSPTFAVFDVNKNGLFDSTEVGFNIKVNRGGLLTQPLFQVLPDPAAGGTTATATTPLLEVLPKVSLVKQFFDRGQATAARAGGVEFDNPKGPGSDPCGLLMTAAQSNTALISESVNTCSHKPRISWRQLK